MESVLIMAKRYFPEYRLDAPTPDDDVLKDLASAPNLRATLPEWLAVDEVRGEVLRVENCDALHSWVVKHCMLVREDYLSREVAISHGQLQTLKDTIEASLATLSSVKRQSPEALGFISNPEFVEQLKGVLDKLELILETPEAWRYRFSYYAIWDNE